MHKVRKYAYIATMKTNNKRDRLRLNITIDRRTHRFFSQRRGLAGKVLDDYAFGKEDKLGKVSEVIESHTRKLISREESEKIVKEIETIYNTEIL